GRAGGGRGRGGADGERDLRAPGRDVVGDVGGRAGAAPGAGRGSGVGPAAGGGGVPGAHGRFADGDEQRGGDDARVRGEGGFGRVRADGRGGAGACDPGRGRRVGERGGAGAGRGAAG